MIAFLISELDVRGGTHKQFLKLLEYSERQSLDFVIITKKVDFNKTYPGFRKYEDRIRYFPNVVHSSTVRKVCYMVSCMYTLRQLIKDVDIINIHDAGFEQFFPAFIGKRTYWQINDLPYCFKVGVAKGERSLRDRILKKYVTLFSNVITEFTVNVTKNKERIQTCFQRNAHVFYCGIESVGISRNISESLDRFGERTINILTSGVFFPYRNYETQITVIKLLRKKGINACLNIIGSTALNKEYASHIQKLISDNNLNEYIKICGQVDEDRFKQLHQNSDLFLFVNIDQSWGLAVFEAMSCSIPVIISKSVGATEILTNGVDAIFVDPVNPDEIVSRIASLLSDTDTYTRLAHTSGAYYKLYSWDDTYCSKMINLMIHG